MRKDHGNRGYEIHFHFEGRTLKIYDKGRHQFQSDNILRIENKITKKRTHPAIDTLEDLKTKVNWHLFCEKLIANIKDLIVLDEPDYQNEISNPGFW